MNEPEAAITSPHGYVCNLLAERVRGTDTLVLSASRTEDTYFPTSSERYDSHKVLYAPLQVANR